jgi:hypothetical protein
LNTDADTVNTDADTGLPLTSVGTSTPTPASGLGLAPTNPRTPIPTQPGRSLGARPDAANEVDSTGNQEPVTSHIPDRFFTLSGRTGVWVAGWKIFKESPVLGRGFQADRFLLGTHMHNSMMHAMVQTGVLGTIPLLVALIFIWTLMIRALINRASLPVLHRNLVIQLAGILTFFTVRTFSESTGAFFGVDWILLAPVLVYLQMINQLLTDGPDSMELKSEPAI